MTEAMIYRQLTDILNEVLETELKTVTQDMTAADIDGWDSLSHIRLIITIEKEFGVKFSASDVGRLQTVGDLAKLLEQRTS